MMPKQNLEFLYRGQLAGSFDAPDYPRTAGRYRYMPYRSPGHHDMQVALKTGPVRCSFKGGLASYEFIVSSTPENGVLMIDAVRRRWFSFFRR